MRALVTLLVLVSAFGAYGRGLVIRRLLASVSVSAAIAVNPAFAATPPDSTLQDQLRVLQALQKVEEPRKKEPVSDVGAIDADFNIITGTVSISSQLLATDPANYPLGLMDASSLSSKFSSNDKASLIVTAVGRNGPPLAARKYQLKDMKFPFLFSLSTRDLMFPYNREIWAKSSVSTDTLAVTCVLDPDGMLSKPDIEERFGFTISDKINTGSRVSLDSGIPIGAGAVGGRGEVRVVVSLRSDGKEYSEAERELLAKIDSFLN